MTVKSKSSSLIFFTLLLLCCANLVFACTDIPDNDIPVHTETDSHAAVSGTLNGTTWGYAIAGSLVCCAMSLAGVSIFWVDSNFITKYIGELTGLSVGVFLGSAFFTIIPEVAELLNFAKVETCSVMLAGIIFGLITESFLHHHHHHHAHHHGDHAKHNHDSHAHGSSESHVAIPLGVINKEAECEPKTENNRSIVVEPASYSLASKEDQPAAVEIEQVDAAVLTPFATINLVADLLHNFVDGLLIGATFIVSHKAGLTATIAIAVHEIPQEISDFAMLVHSGLSRQRALLYNVGVSMSSLLGCIIALAAGSHMQSATNYFLPFAGGLFLYLALASLSPELHEIHDKSSKLRSLFLVAFGVVIMYLITLIGGHSHEGESGHAH